MSSTPAWMNFALLQDLDWLAGRPILLIAGDEAHSLYFSEDVYKDAPEPKELYLVEGSNHVDLYDRVEKIPFAKIESFFADALK